MLDERTEGRKNGKRRTGKKLRQNYVCSYSLFALTFVGASFCTYRTCCSVFCAVMQVGSNLVV
jgi:hypothetical protein